MTPILFGLPLPNTQKQILSDEDLYSLLYTEAGHTEPSSRHLADEKQEAFVWRRPEHGDMPDLTLTSDNDPDQAIFSTTFVSNRLSALLQGVVRQSWKHRQDVDVYRAYMEVIERK